jgi:hypothetical protein
MYAERYIRIFAGAMILSSVGVGAFVNPWGLVLAAFVGANLFQFGVTELCPMKTILVKLGVRLICDGCPKQFLTESDGVLGMNSRLDVTRTIRIVAGAFVLISTALGAFVSPNALIFTAFVGANLFQFGITGLCPMATALCRLGFQDNERAIVEDGKVCGDVSVESV